MQGIKNILNVLFSEKSKKHRDSIIGISIMALFVVASTLVNRAIFAANNAGYGYGYSSNSYNYGYGYSDATPATPTGFVCSSTSSTATQCTWNIVNTTTSGTAISSSEFGSYKLYRSTTSPASSSNTLVATVSTQSTLTASDSGLTAGTTYYYALYALDSNANTSSAVLASVTPGGTSGGGGGSSSSGGSGSASGTTTSVDTATSTTSTGTTTTTTTTTTSTTNATGAEQIAQITSEASTVVAMGSEGLADLVGVERSLTVEKAAVSLLGKASLSVTTETIAFVSYGTPSSTHLGSGERAGVLGSYIGAYKSFPKTAEEWADLLKIANGRWPSKRSTSAETVANSQFEKIYLRKADRTKAHDDAAVMIMGYGLRPGPKQRNLDSERRAITIYRGIFKASPSTSAQWDTARAIGYSGASR